MIYSTKIQDPNIKFNLGNQLFTIASLLGFAKRYGTKFALKEKWAFQDFFNLEDVEILKQPLYVILKEPDLTCCYPFFDRFKTLFQNEVVGIDGYLQSYKYWADCKDDIRRILSFKEEMVSIATQYIEHHHIDIKNSVAISVRRGDFILDSHHYLLPKDYYVNAYRSYFAERDVVVFSDDQEWSRKNLSDMADTVVFADGLSPLRQLCLMSMFGHFVIANSTFSWWGAYLSNAIGKVVVRPYHHFDGDLKGTDLGDHYPAEWKTFNHTNI